MQQEHDRKYDEATGSDLPKGDGTVGDEQVNAITVDGSDKPTGQDHSTDVEDREPTTGVGGVQDSSIAGTDVADISD